MTGTVAFPPTTWSNGAVASVTLNSACGLACSVPVVVAVKAVTLYIRAPFFSPGKAVYGGWNTISPVADCVDGTETLLSNTMLVCAAAGLGAPTEPVKKRGVWPRMLSMAT